MQIRDYLWDLKYTFYVRSYDALQRRFTKKAAALVASSFAFVVSKQPYVSNFLLTRKS